MVNEFKMLKKSSRRDGGRGSYDRLNVNMNMSRQNITNYGNSIQEMTNKSQLDEVKASMEDIDFLVDQPLEKKDGEIAGWVTRSPSPERELSTAIEMVGPESTTPSPPSPTLTEPTTPDRLMEKQDSCEPLKVTTIKIGGMMCSNCSQTIEKGLRFLKGVKNAQVQLLLETATIAHFPSVLTAETICEEVEDLGFDAKVLTSLNEGEDHGLAKLKIIGKIVSKEELPEGVVSVNETSSKTYTVTYQSSLIGARAILKTAQIHDPSAEVQTRELIDNSMDELLRLFLIALPFGLIVFYLAMLAPASVKEQLSVPIGFLPGLHIETLVMFVLATPVMFYCGARFHKGAYRAISNRNPNMEVLISTATNIAYFYSCGMMLFALIGSIFFNLKCDAPPPHFFEAPTTLICFMLLGKYIEGKAKHQTATSLDALLALTPDIAHLKDGKDIPVQLAQVGDEMVVYPGETIPCDGVKLNEGTVAVDESMLTGENVGVIKNQGDKLIGGTILLTGNVTLVVDCVGDNTTLSQITHLIETAQATKAPVQQIADSIARVFVPIIFAIASITVIVWSLIVGFNVISMDNDMLGMSEKHVDMRAREIFSMCAACLFVLKFGLAVLLIACPCALGLATPTAVMVASSVSADNGILIKSILPLENVRKMKVAVCDKTGTLTKGLPTVCQAIFVAPSTDSADDSLQKVWEQLPKVENTLATETATSWTDGVKRPEFEEAFWTIAAVTEKGSEHPLAKSIVDLVRFNKTPMEANRFANVNRGIEATIKKCKIRIGNLEFTGKDSVPQQLSKWADSFEHMGNTVVYVTVNQQVIAAVSIVDNLAAGALQTVQYLQKRGVKVVMCTGDSQKTANAVAKKLGITQVYAQVLPQDKIRIVKDFQTACGTTLMVGDGLNDAAALGQADIGVAIGCGAQVTVGAADVVLVRSDISDVISLCSLADATVRTIYRNFIFSFIFNAVLVPVAAGVLYPLGITIPPLIAGLCMSCSSICVISSSLYLKNWVPPKKQHTLLSKSIGRKVSSEDEREDIMEMYNLTV